MTAQRLGWIVALALVVISTKPAAAEDPLTGGLPPPGARPEPAGKPRGYHQKHYGGIRQGTLPAIWSDLDEVYRENMHNVFTYKPWKWRYGYPVGYAIGAECQAGGPFGNTERCGLTPLHYRSEAPTVFAGPRPEWAGTSWYRLQPAAPVLEAGLTQQPPEDPGTRTTPAPRPHALPGLGSALDR